MGFSILKLLDRVKPAAIAYAHCDIPCGIYDPKPAQIAAQTVQKMVEKIEQLPKAQLGSKEGVQVKNSFTRMVQVKEEHAQICKKELLILWTDYFKEEHLKMFPDLHETFWKAAKLCSKNKQEVSLESAKALVAAVDEIARMFQKAEQTKK